MSRKEAILETALELFNQSNTQSATTNHIAKMMGISPGNLHYHYKNREEIVRLLYIKLREEMSLSVDALPKTLDELHEHEKLLIQIQWKYRFFFKEMLFLFSRDEELETLYIKDNLAHHSRIKIVMQNLVANDELEFVNDDALNFLVDSILISWQFYNSYLHTIGKSINTAAIAEVIAFTTAAMRPYIKQKDKNASA